MLKQMQNSSVGKNPVKKIDNVWMAEYCITVAKICLDAVKKPGMETNVEGMREIADNMIKESKKWISGENDTG